MKRILLLVLCAAFLQAGIKPPKKRDRQEDKPVVIPDKPTPTRLTYPKKRTCKRDKLLEKVKLANPGQNARLLLRSPMHLRTFFPGTQVYTVR